MGASVEELKQHIEKLENMLEENLSALASVQESLAHAEARLEEVTQIYQTTFDLAAIGIAHLTLDGKWIRVNPFMCEMLGYSKEE